MTDCPNGDIRDLLPDLLHGRLSAASRAEVEAHLRACADCRDELELLRGMRTALGRTPTIDVDRIVAGIPPYRAPVRQMPSRSWGNWRIAAAITLLAAGATSVAVARQGTSARSDSASAAHMREFDSMPGSAQVAVTVDRAVAGSSTVATSEASGSPRELALASGTIGDLDDSELSTLIDDLGSLSAVTPAEPDNAATVSPIAPISPSGMNN